MTDIQIWRYVVKPTKYGEWGIFLLDSTGYFSVVSDFGNYAHLWTHHGCEDFREFLVDLEPDYLCSKLCTKKVPDEDRTLEDIRKAVEEALENGTIPPVERTEEEMALDELEVDGVRHGFQEWSEHTRLPDAWEYMRYDYPGDLKSFAEKVYPRFVEQLRKDLSGINPER